MKAVFIHDHNFVFDNKTNCYYDGSGGVFNIDLWNRYLKIFTCLKVIGRRVEKLPNQLVLSSAPNVEFCLIEDLKNPLDRFLKEKTVKLKIKQIISDIDFAIIRLPSVLGLWAIDVCKLLNKKYILEIVGDPFDSYWNYGGIKGKIIAPVEALKLKNATRKASYCIYVTQKYLQSRYPTNGYQIGISNVQLGNISDETSVKNFYNIEKKIFKIGLIGTFHVKFKGHKEAVFAIANIKKNNPEINFKLYLVGTGNFDWVRDLAIKLDVLENIEFVGFLKAGQYGILPFLESLDLYIHPSKSEGLPRVVIEAMSKGKICIASSVAGLPELLDKKFLHKPGDWKALSKLIVEVINLPFIEKQLIAMRNLNHTSKFLGSLLQQKREDIINKAIK